jgi:hypothetical protein
MSNGPERAASFIPTLRRESRGANQLLNTKAEIPAYRIISSSKERRSARDAYPLRTAAAWENSEHRGVLGRGDERAGTKPMLEAALAPFTTKSSRFSVYTEEQENACLKDK